MPIKILNDRVSLKDLQKLNKKAAFILEADALMDFMEIGKVLVYQGTL